MIDVCICTFRRESLTATLQSLADQAPGTPEFRVIVADNDSTDRRRAGIERTGDELGLVLRYIHAPHANISIARNACLEASAGDWIAFIDDDETASPGWLKALMEPSHGADIVFGPVAAIYPSDAPAWLVRGDFHRSQVGPREGAWNGYSGNVLIRRDFLARHPLRFDVRWGLSGGEDTMFFYLASTAGGRFAFADKAVVFEPVAASRASLRWLARRRFRSGQTHGEIAAIQGRRAISGAAAAVKCAVLGIAGVALVWNRARAARQWLRAALHAGVVASALGFRPIALYGSSEGI